MKMVSRSTAAITFMALSAVFSTLAHAQTAPAQESSEFQPRSIWGGVAKISSSSVFSTLGDWLGTRLTGGTTGNVPAAGFVAQQTYPQQGYPQQGYPQQDYQQQQGQTGGIQGILGQLAQGAMIGAQQPAQASGLQGMVGQLVQGAVIGSLDSLANVISGRSRPGAQPGQSGAQQPYPQAGNLQPGYPAQPGYPGQADPMQQQGYPQAQAGYPQAQPYAPAAQGYAQTQGGYPQQDPGMQPQQGYPQAQTGYPQAYPQAQAGYPQPMPGQPQPYPQQAYPQAQASYPQPMPGQPQPQAYPQQGYPQTMPGQPQAQTYPQQAYPQAQTAYPQQMPGQPQQPGYPQQAYPQAQSGFPQQVPGQPPQPGYPQPPYPQAQPGYPQQFASAQPQQLGYPQQGYPQPGYPMVAGYAARSAILAENFFMPRDVVIGRPNKPLELQDKEANYQGVHVAIVTINAQGKPEAIRSVKDGFRSGERFKLRVVATFEGLVAIENINPKGEKKHIYPEGNNVVGIPQGKETLIPLGEDEWFELTGTTGKEQLVVTVRDRRAFGEAVSENRVFRQDEKYGTNFVQEVSPNKTFPVITQSLTFDHSL